MSATRHLLLIFAFGLWGFGALGLLGIGFKSLKLQTQNVSQHARASSMSSGDLCPLEP